MNPKIEHYPKWLREYICPEIGKLRAYTPRKEFEENMSALHKLAIMSAKDPQARIIFEMVLEGIRLKFKVYAIQDGLLKKCVLLEDQVKKINTTLYGEEG